MPKNKTMAAKRTDFVTRLAMMKVEAFNLGLIKTAAALDTAAAEVGWEIAEANGQSTKVRERYDRAVHRRIGHL